MEAAGVILQPESVIMSLDHSPLPGFMMADLFRHSLIHLENESVFRVDQPAPEEEAVQEAGSPEAEAPPPAIPYLGQNGHRILIAVHTLGHPFLAPEALDFLVSILKACQRNMDHVAVVNFAALEPSPEHLKTQLDPRLIMLFGAYPLFSSLMDNQIDFTLLNQENMQIMRAPALETMIGTGAESRALKGKLWLMLKQLFNL